MEEALGTNPLAKDSDGDGIEDGVEVAIGTDPLDDQDPAVRTDSNGDGVPDAYKISLGLSVSDPDSDGDGYPDYWELAVGTDPLDPESRPSIGDVNGDGSAEFLDAVIIFNVFLGNFSANDYRLPQYFDLNRDGLVDSVDGVILFNWWLGNIKYIPYKASLE